jgi:hypothetical protein
LLEQLGFARSPLVLGEEAELAELAVPRDGRRQELEPLRLRSQHLVEPRRLGSERGKPVRDRSAFRFLERARTGDLRDETRAGA